MKSAAERDDHLCTSEVAACLEVFTIPSLNARQPLPVDLDDAAHRRLRSLCLQGNPARTESSP